MLRRKGKEKQKLTAAEGKETTCERSSLRELEGKRSREKWQIAFKNNVFSTEMGGKKGKISLDVNGVWR